MTTPVDPNTITNFYPVLQPLLANVQSMVPAGTKASGTLQKQALTEIANTQTAENSKFQSKLADSLNAQVNKYIDVSHRLNDYNEIYNTNKYIQRELSSEEIKMNKLNSKLRNQIFSSKQKSQMYEYERNKLQFYKNLLLITSFVAIDLLVITGFHMAGAVTSNFFYMLLGTLGVIYMVVVGTMLYANSFRSHTDWNKFYWASAISDNNAQTCK
jgi:hypothetical protein